MDKPISQFTDLELAKAQGQLYQQLMQIQGNLMVVSQELDKRTPKEEKKEKPEE